MLFINIIEKALEDIEVLFDEKSLNFFKEYDYDELVDFHFTLGLAIRNNILEPDSDLYQLFYNCGIEQKDDMSSLLMKLFYVYIKSKKP